MPWYTVAAHSKPSQLEEQEASCRQYAHDRGITVVADSGRTGAGLDVLLYVAEQ